jgi:hypothetical protein
MNIAQPEIQQIQSPYKENKVKRNIKASSQGGILKR